MMKTSLVLAGLLSGNAAAANLRSGSVDSAVEHLDLELMVEGERQLFPLLPGTK